MATTITLNWAPNPAAEQVTSYDVYESKDGAAFTFKANVAAPTLDILNPAPGVYQWKTQAKNFVGTSGDSGIAQGPDIPTPPATPTVTVVSS
jgi:hypothetical protein